MEVALVVGDLQLYNKYYNFDELKDLNPELAKKIGLSRYEAERYLYKISRDGGDIHVDYKLNPEFSSIAGKVSGSVSSMGTLAGTSTGSFTGTATGKSSGYMGGTVTNKTGLAILSVASTIISSLASLFLGVMWGSLITAGIQGIKAGYNAHRANTMRREEILQQLMAAKKQE